MQNFVPSWFGKLPQHREYINRGERRLSEVGMREWLDGGVQLARSDLGRDGKDRLALFPQTRFIWPGPGAYVAGCIDRGGDAAGRGYPFAVFGDFRDPVGASERLPVQLGRLCASLGGLVEDARGAPDIQIAQSTLSGGVGVELLPDGALDEFLAMPVHETLGVGASADVSRHQLVQGLVDSLGVFRGQPRDRLRVGVKFRLGRPESCDHETSFWLSAAAAVLGAPLGEITCLWSPGNDDYPAAAFLFFRPPTAAQFLGVLDPEHDVRSISRVDLSYSPKPPEERMAEPLRAVVDDGAATLSDLLRALSDHKG